MEEIQHSLSNDEQILWSHDEETTIISGEECSLWFSLIVVCFWTIIVIGISTQGDLMDFPLYFLFFFYLIPVGCTVGAIIQIPIKRKTLQMTVHQLRHYKQFIILTNKRWIQRRYDNFKLKKKRVLASLAEFHGDILFIPLAMVESYEIDDRSSSTDWDEPPPRRLRLNISSAVKTNWATNLGYTYIDSRPSEQSNPEFKQLLESIQKTGYFELNPVKVTKDLKVYNKKP